MGAGTFWFLSPPDPLSQASADRIEPGMTFEKVNALLHGEGFVYDRYDIRYLGNDIWGGVWRYKERGYFMIGFDGHGVTLSAQIHRCDISLLDRFRACLGW